MPLSKRFQERAERPIHRDSFVHPWPEVGLAVADSPNDPTPSLRIADGRIVEMDGVAREQMDLLDLFIAEHAIALDAAYEAMSTPAEAIARLLVDINVPRSRIIRLASGCTAARAASGNRPNAADISPATTREAMSAAWPCHCASRLARNNCSLWLFNSAPYTPIASMIALNRMVVLMPEAIPARSLGTQAMMFFCVSPLRNPAPAPVTAMARAKGR